jgi:hypothetical protein
LKKNYLETMCKGLKMSQEIRLGYYAHGPLAKIELGQHTVETQNFAYTLQGWIKGVKGENFSYALGYNSQDYTSIGNSNGILPTPVAKNLFNGNIATMATDIPKFGELGEGSRFDQAFSYDQLNRLKSSQQLTGEGYKTSYMYDPSGNIEALTRNDKQGNALDRLSYNYENKASQYKYNTNKLRSVDDATVTAASTSDLEDQGIDNYEYDDIGNLLKDDQEDIQEIKWTVYGKVQSVTRKAGSTKPSLEFSYDASGNRVAKKVINTDGTIKTTFYVRDASGNTMAVYEKESSGALPILSEQHIYGSQRLGMIKPSLASLQAGRHVVGIRSYELSDHLGNVSVVLSDYKLSSSSTLSATSYYPFGMMARSYNSGDYRFGNNTQEKVEELGDNHYTAMYWEYDARLGRRWNIDPVIKPWISSYASFSNNPILMVDPNGDDDFVSHSDGSIERKETKAKTHSFYSESEDGKLKHLGTYKIVDVKRDLVQLPKAGDGWVKKDKNEKNYLAGDAAAIFLSVANEYKAKTGYKVYVTQFSTNIGGHSGHEGDGDYVDLKYVDNSGGHASTSDDDYDEDNSQLIVDLYRKYGYRSSTRQNKSTFDIITGKDGKPALAGTEYVSGHVSHIHVGNYGFTHVKLVNSISILEKSNSSTSKPEIGKPSGDSPGFLGWLKDLDRALEGNSSGPDGH